jgi:hypothetical protein
MTNPQSEIRNPKSQSPPSPYQRAHGWHLAGGWHWSFEQVIAAHAHNGGGQVHVTPEVFVLARPVCRAWPEEWICDPQRVAARADGGGNAGGGGDGGGIASADGIADCWHVWLLAGDAPAALRYLPYELPFMSWHRRGKLRVHALAEVVRSFA